MFLEERNLNVNKMTLSYISSLSWEAAALAIAVKVSSTFVLVLALASKYYRLPLFLHHYLAFMAFTFLSASPLSILLPTIMNGKFSGSFGVPCMRNSSFQDSRDSNDYTHQLEYISLPFVL